MSNIDQIKTSDSRIDRVVGYCAAFSNEIIEKLVSLNNHKGTLECYWNDFPSLMERKIVGEAWEVVAYENSEMVNHFVGDKELD